MTNIYLLSAIMIGAIFAMQAAINGAASKMLGTPIAASALSVGITLVACATVMLATRSTPPMASFAALPWWIFLGGVLGFIVVTGSAGLVPVTGAVLFIVCLIAGQLLGSVLLDHFGAFGLEVQKISPIRVLGVLLTFSGVLLVRFGG